MDMDILRSSRDIPLTGEYFPLEELGMGSYTPSKDQKVTNMNFFIFEKDSGKIILQKKNKVTSVWSRSFISDD